MNIVFLGTGAFGLPSLEALALSTHHLAGIVTTRSKPRGRGLEVQPSPVADWATKRGIPVREWEKPVPASEIEALRALEPDCLVVIAFGLLLTPPMLAIPKKLPVNVHASLLPKYRGAAPIHRALMDGEKETGVAVIRMVEKLDAGGVLHEKRLPILPEDDFESLETRLAALGAEALIDTLSLIERGKPRETPQEEALASYAKKITKEDGRIDWTQAAASIANQVKALCRWPVASASFGGKRVLVRAARPIAGAAKDARPGQVLSSGPSKPLVIATGEGGLELLNLQKEGGRPLDAAEFQRGFALPEGAFFE